MHREAGGMAQSMTAEAKKSSTIIYILMVLVGMMSMGPGHGVGPR